MKDPQLQAFGMNVCQWRHKRGYTQEGLAELADVDEKHLQNIEYGNVDPGYKVLKRLRKALDISWDEFMEGESRLHRTSPHGRAGEIDG